MSCCSGDGSVAPITPPSKKQIASITITSEAAKHIAQLLEKEKKQNHGLKIEVVPGGCAGYKYYMTFQEKPSDGDKTFEFHGIKIFLDLMSLGLLKGSTIEFVQSLEATGLKINNPNATRACGCGKSFG
jgi:iron-sulfur cluster assembly protein